MSSGMPKSDALEAEHFASVVAAFREYALVAAFEIERRRRHLEALSAAHKALLPRDCIDSKIGALAAAVRANQTFFNDVVAPHVTRAARDLAAAIESGHVMPPVPPVAPNMPTTPPRHWAKLRATLHQCVRDWAEEGSAERESCYGVIISELEARLPVTELNRNQLMVLVPGAGLGRLVFDLAIKGYATQGSEFSYFMLLTGSYILNRTSSAGCVSIHPWVDNPSNVRRASHATRPVRIPDVCPSDAVESNPGCSMSMVAGEFVEVYGCTPNAWDAVVTCFFLDTAPVVLEYIEVLYRILKPGGLWINLGPLLYHWQSAGGGAGGDDGADDAADDRYDRSVELSLEEVMHAVRGVGFDVVLERTVRTTYTANALSMMHVVYDAALFVAYKRPEGAGDNTASATDACDRRERARDAE